MSINFGKCVECETPLDIGIIDADEYGLKGQIACNNCGGIYEIEYFTKKGMRKELDEDVLLILNKIRAIVRMLKDV